MMLVIPAIDLKDRQVVRLFQGKFDRVSTYSQKPAQVARGWEKTGAKRIHVVDLDGARTGRLANLSAVGNIRKAVQCPIQVGGGIRTLESVDQVMDLGVNYCILGTAVFENMEVVRQSVKKYGDRIFVSIDTAGGVIKSRGWQKVTAQKIEEVVSVLKDIGVTTVIHTSVNRDGTLEGVDIAEIERFLKVSSLYTIVAGGVGSLADISLLKEHESRGVQGVIIGRALYEGKIDLEKALAKC
jgi:phosphoribosylformimino-5-aminoimidazole carboxamide ribotide isomerase